MKHYGFLYVFGLVCMFISILLDMMAPQITKSLIDDVIVGGQMQLLMKLLLGLLGIGLGRAVFQYGKEFTYDYIGVSIGCRMRKDLFRHVQSMSMDFFDRHNTGELMARVKEDVDKVWVAVGFVGILAVEAVVHTVMVMVCMFRLNPYLTLIPLALLPLIGFCAVHMERKLGDIYDEISEETAELNVVAQECLAGVRTVKAFAKEEYEIEKFSRHNHRFYDLNMKQAEFVAKYDPFITFVGKSMLLAVIVVGGLMVIGGKMTLGELGAFSEYANNVIWPMEIVGWLSNDIASAFASWKKIRKVAAQEAKIEEEEQAEPLPAVRGEIVFEHVGFEIDEHPILHDINFRLEPGKTLGIMGMTGSGKTTLVQLLQRFYDVTEGRILLDGRDIKTLPLSQLRAAVSVVMQDVFLFSDTVSENVKTGRREEILQETIERAAEYAGANRFISRLSGQYETVIGERGVGLSGGQKQRISIARAIAKETPVLVLDDATSALDMETEQLIQKNLRDVQETTKIIIGHRISAVRHADEILILDICEAAADTETAVQPAVKEKTDERAAAGQLAVEEKTGERMAAGQPSAAERAENQMAAEKTGGYTIAERGTHEELMKQKGRYYRTWQVQYGEEGEPCRSIPQEKMN